MADYDVKAVGLGNPPASFPLAPVTPSITVENLGIHDADVTGYLTIIDTLLGVQVFSSPVSLAALGPGETGEASATSPWTPSSAGAFIAFGYVITAHDAYPQNGQLAPVTIVCTGEPAPPPIVVPDHAEQHQDGGDDELDVDGLSGKLADAQDPDAHASTHQVSGPDQINVSGLSGQLASPQTPLPHGNTYHDPDFATESALVAHQVDTLVHASATNLANRETSGPETGLVKADQVAAGSMLPVSDDSGLRKDRLWGPTRATRIGSNSGVITILPGAGFSPIHAITILAKWQDDHLLAQIRAFASLVLANPSSLDVRLLYGAASWITLNIPGHTDPTREAIITAYIYGVSTGLWAASLEYKDDSGALHSQHHHIQHYGAPVSFPSADRIFTLSAQITGAPGDQLTIHGAAALNLSTQP